MRILATARHPGSTKVIEMVVKALQSNPRNQVSLYASDNALKDFLKICLSAQSFSAEGVSYVAGDDAEKLARLETAVDRIIDAEKPDVIVTGTSSVGIGIDEIITARSKVDRNIPVVTVQDFWGTLNQHPSKIKADVYAVLDTEAAKVMEQNFGITNCIVTGSPAFDRFYNYGLAEKRESVRKMLELNPEDKTIVFLSQVSSQAIEAPKTLEALAGSFRYLNNPDRLNLILRMHPRETNPELYTACLRDSPINVLDSSSMSTEEAIAAADIVTTMYSTGALEFMYMTADALNHDSAFMVKAGLPVYLLIEGLGKKALFDANQMTTLPPITLGAAVNAEHEKDLPLLFNSALYDPNFKKPVLLKAQEHYSPGTATEKVVKIIEDIA